MNKETSHLLFSANRWEKNEELKQMLKRHVVISYRYSFSGIAYSIALGSDENWASKTDEGLVEPDFLIFIDIDPSETYKRENFG